MFFRKNCKERLDKREKGAILSAAPERVALWKQDSAMRHAGCALLHGGARPSNE